MYTVRALNQDSRRKDYLPVYIFIDCATSLKHYSNNYFSDNLKAAFVAHYEEEGKNTKIKETYQCDYWDLFFRCNARKTLLWMLGALFIAFRMMTWNVMKIILNRNKNLSFQSTSGFDH